MQLFAVSIVASLFAGQAYGFDETVTFDGCRDIETTWAVFGGKTPATWKLTAVVFDNLRDLLKVGGATEANWISLTSFVDKPIEKLGNSNSYCAKLEYHDQVAHSDALKPIKKDDTMHDADWDMSGFDAITRYMWGASPKRPKARVIPILVTDGKSHVYGDVEKVTGKVLRKLTKKDVYGNKLNEKCSTTEYVSIEDLAGALESKILIRFIAVSRRRDEHMVEET